MEFTKNLHERTNADDRKNFMRKDRSINCPIFIILIKIIYNLCQNSV